MAGLEHAWEDVPISTYLGVGIGDPELDSRARAAVNHVVHGVGATSAHAKHLRDPSKLVMELDRTAETVHLRALVR